MAVKQDSSPLISIIIPILNEEKRLEKLLPYLLKHTKNSEIIVVSCDATTDRSEAVCNSFSIPYYSISCASRALQMNHGAKIAQGNIFMFLHADVIPPSTFEKDIIEQIEDGYRAGFFAYDFNPSNKWLAINAKFTRKDGLFAGGGDQCQFFTRELFQNHNGYDANYVIMEDFALIRKLKRASIPLAIIQNPAIVSSRKYHKNSYLKVNLVNFMVFLAFLLGVSPSTLKKMYSFSLK